MIESSGDAVERILQAWEDSGLTMPRRQGTLMDKTAAAHNALSDSVVDRINEAIETFSPRGEHSELLAAIDAYYGEMLDRKQSARELSVLLGKSFRPKEVTGGRRSSLGDRYVDVLMVVAPLVSLSEIFRMESMDDDFIGKMELAFLTRLGLPRSVDESQGAYEAILDLRRTSVRHTIFGREKQQQAFKAQMLFAFLVTVPHEKHSPLWNWTKECIESCPDYLVDIPGYGQAGSARPSFWLSTIQDEEMAAFLRARGSQQVKMDIDKTLGYREKQQASASAVAAGAVEPLGSLSDRVGAEQQDLVALLELVDSHLDDNHGNLRDDLAQGVSNTQIEKLNEALAPLCISEDLATLFKWHNGLPEPASLIGYPEPLSIENALHWYRESANILAEFGWSKVWFPLANEGRSYLIVLLSEEWVESTPVFRLDLEEGELQLEHDSIQQLVETHLTAIRNGSAVYDESISSYEMDYDKINEIRLTLSPLAYHHKSNPKPKYDMHDPSSWLPLWKKYKA